MYALSHHAPRCLTFLSQKRLMGLLPLSHDTSIGFCHADQGCKFAYTGLHASNGIVKGTSPGNDTFYVADCVLGDVTVLERQSDNTLALMEVIKTGTPADVLITRLNFLSCRSGTGQSRH